jgi:hypothetical protein
VLRNGDVLVAGGYDSSGALASAVLYDPAANAWTPTGSLHVPSEFASSALLPSGEVLVAGGSGVPERYNVASGSWSLAGTPKQAAMPGTLATLASLPSGDVVLAGGLQSTGGVANVAVYYPATNSWTTQPAIPDGVSGARAFTIASGVLFAGGGDSTLGKGLKFTPRTGAYVFHPAAADGGSTHANPTPVKAFSARSSNNSAWTGPLAWVGYSLLLILLIGGFLATRRRKRPMPSV